MHQELMQDRPGFKGKGYATNFSDNSSCLKWLVPHRKGGRFLVQIRYASQFGDKGVVLKVNGKLINATLTKTARWSLLKLGTVELQPGDNTIIIEKGWGYYDIVSIDAYPQDHRDPLEQQWNNLLERFDGRKILGLSEFPGAIDVEKAWSSGVRWSFFVSWSGDVGPRKSTDPMILLKTYRSSKIINHDDWANGTVA